MAKARVPVPGADGQLVQWDEQGRPYQNISNGERWFLPPSVATQGSLGQDPRARAYAERTPGPQQGGFWKGRGQWNSTEGEYQQPTNWGNIAGLGIGAAIGAEALPLILGGGGGAAASAAGSIPEIAVSSTPLAGVATPSIGSTLATAGGGKGIMGLGSLGKIFGTGGGKLDPTMMAIAGLSALTGGGDSGGGNQRQSFSEPGANTDPRQALNQAIEAILRTGQGLSERKPVSLRSSYVPRPAAPISLPGLSFQIGGGLGHDPALDDPTLLGLDRGTSGSTYDPFQSLATSKPKQPNPTRERSPR